MNTVNLLHARFGHYCGHPQRGVNMKDVLQETSKANEINITYKVLKSKFYNIC